MRVSKFKLLLTLLFASVVLFAPLLHADEGDSDVWIMITEQVNDWTATLPLADTQPLGLDAMEDAQVPNVMDVVDAEDAGRVSD
jgi:hypothetical protein